MFKLRLPKNPTPRRRWPQSILAVIAILSIGAFVWLQFGPRGNVHQSESIDTVSDGLSESTVPTSQQRTTATTAIPNRPSFTKQLNDEYAKLNPRQDGWETETFHEAAQAQLKQLAKLLTNPAKLDAAHLSAIVTEPCMIGLLRPAELEVVFDDRTTSVLRGPELTNNDSPPVRRTLDETADALSQLCGPLRDAQTSRAKFKIYRVKLEDERAKTTVYLNTSCTHVDGAIQQNTTWQLQWELGSQDQPPRLTAIRSEDYEEVRTLNATTLLSDCTESIMGANRAYREELLPGLDHWTGSVHALLGMEAVGYCGMALGDVNQDGLDDVYVSQPGGLPNRLFVQNADGTVTEDSARAGVDWLEKTRCALFVDLDNDGDQDLLIATERDILIMSNDGTGQFVRRETFHPDGKPTSMAAADFDDDGDLDVYLCGYGNLWGGFGEFDTRYPMPYYDANNGGANTLLRNDGQFRFTSATKQVGLDVNNQRWSLAAAWEDFDNDGDQDLYVANDFGRNNLYRNDGDAFVDIAPEAGVEDISPGMSVDWGDFNNDGLMDIYVSNMFSGAGNRITFQDQFQVGADESTRGHFQRFARGNALFVNNGDGKFKDISVSSGVTVGRWAWGSKFLDLNNDGQQDLVVANGFLTQEDTTDL